MSARGRKTRQTDTEGEQEVTQTYEEALEAGFYGTKQDPEPNETYTASGSPEAKARADARDKGVPEDQAHPADELTGTPTPEPVE